MAARFMGAHMSTAGGGLGMAVRNGKSIGCTAVQVFTSSPRQWRSKPPTDDMVADFKSACDETGISEVVSHDSYLVNLSSIDAETQAKSYVALGDELRRCAAYGIRYVVSHIGGYKHRTEDEAIELVASEIIKLLDETPNTVNLLMETTAGQGNCLNSRFEQIAQIMDKAGAPKRLKVCLDTCHIFAAGYDIRTEEAYENTIREFDRIVGIDQIKVIHCNDSKKDLGTKVDRHEEIGKGLIGVAAFECLVNDPRFTDTPMILETPDIAMHKENLALLRSLFH